MRPKSRLLMIVLAIAAVAAVVVVAQTLLGLDHRPETSVGAY